MKHWFVYVQDEHDSQPRPATFEEIRQFVDDRLEFEPAVTFWPTPALSALLKDRRDAN